MARSPSLPASGLLRLNRRTVLGLGGMGLLGLGLPRVGRAAGPGRKFLFVYCKGGWDTTSVFTPMSSAHADVEPDASEAQAHGIPFVDHPERPAVRRFFEDWGSQACVLNGMEVQSVTHERCRQIVLTGRSDQGGDDWPAVLAASSASPLVMPHLVLSGPSFSAAHSSKVVRVGSQGQLTDLLDGDALSDADMSTSQPAGAASVDAWLGSRLDRVAAAAQGGEHRTHAQAFASGYSDSLEDLAVLDQIRDELDLTPLSRDCSRDIQADFATAFDCFSLGISRCAMVEYNGWCSQGWDTHQRPELQSLNYEEIFDHLDQMMAMLSSRTGEEGGSLADEVVVVVFSEMGRHPRFNSWGGKDHWTFTSAMLLGAGIKGGQVVGGLDASSLGRPVDLDTGATGDGGTLLLPRHLGATLMSLGEVEHAEEDVIRAVLA